MEMDFRRRINLKKSPPLSSQATRPVLSVKASTATLANAAAQKMSHSHEKKNGLEPLQLRNENKAYKMNENTVEEGGAFFFIHVALFTFGRWGGPSGSNLGS